MPNNQLLDFVPVHRHSASDVDGLGVVLFPPTLIALGVTSGPTRTLSAYAFLTDMFVDVPAPTNFPLWEAQITFTGEFTHSADGSTVGIRIDADGDTVPNSTRTGSAPGAGGHMVLAVEATIIVEGGQSVPISIQWSNVPAAGTATAVGTSRRMEVTYRPYQPAAI